MLFFQIPDLSAPTSFLHSHSSSTIKLKLKMPQTQLIVYLEIFNKTKT